VSGKLCASRIDESVMNRAKTAKFMTEAAATFFEKI
jgi:hypothetical protein